MLIVTSLIVMFLSSVEVNRYPDDIATPTTCAEFSQFARFNPYSVLNQEWLVFYYWGPFMSETRFAFKYPNEKERKFLHATLDGHVSIKVNWTARIVLMRSLLMRGDFLLVEKGDRGQFWMYELHEDTNGHKLDPVDVRLKQVQNNKYIGFMVCKTSLVLVMAKLMQVPTANLIADAVATIGYKGRGGKSYLYQGHHWMPIPEIDENEYWGPPELPEEILKAMNDTANTKRQ